MVRQPDGALRASPFYVRFGNAQSFLRGREAKVVTVTVNGTLSDLTMRLGSNGEAYFADGTDDFDDEEESESEGGVDVDALSTPDEARAVEALEALRLDTPTSKTSALNAEEECEEEGIERRERATEEEVGEAVRVIQGARMTVLPSVELSLCGGKVEEFDKHLVSLEKFKSQPALISHAGLVVRPKRDAGGAPAKALPWNAAAPHVLSHLAFGTPLPSNWTPSSTSGAPTTPSITTGATHHAEISPRRGSHRVRRVQLTQDEVMSLDLKPGINTISFAFNSRVWGLQEVSAFVYLWDWNIKLVVSDVDGTITKSDVLGQLAPIVGKDWSHDGVATLYNNITDNGYKMMFLTSRAISHASGTRKYLSSLRQGDKTLARGPVMCAPDPLSKALFREVVTRNPQRFKIRCLQDIRNLFPSGWNPFHAGFGNRDTDVQSYLAVGIPQHRIFTINPKGEVVCEMTKRVRQYTLSEVNELAHEMFPVVEIENMEATPAITSGSSEWQNPVSVDFGSPI